MLLRPCKQYNRKRYFVSPCNQSIQSKVNIKVHGLANDLVHRDTSQYTKDESCRQSALQPHNTFTPE